MSAIYAEYIEAAAKAIFAQDFQAARIALSKAQRAEYGMRPWERGVPTKDACGNSIVFEDGSGCYSIPQLREDGTHIRIILGDRRRVYPPLAFESHAATQTEAIVLGYSYGHTARLRNVEIDGAFERADGWKVVRFRHRSDCLD